MAEGEQSNITVGKKLFEIYREGVDLYEAIEKNSESLPFNSLEFQEKVKCAISLFEDGTRLVSLVGMFSSNETIEEISTDNLQFLLLPYFLGQLVQKCQSNDRENALRTSQVYFKDFIKRCEEYEVTERMKVHNESGNNVLQDDNSMKALLDAANRRNSKLEQYRKIKELEEQIAALKIATQSPNVDDEVKRKLYIQQLEYCIIKAKEELFSIEQELSMLEYRKNLPHTKLSTSDNQMGGRHNVRTHCQSKQLMTPLRPIIITKDIAQKTVFGMGYPSLPVMTVSEFYDQRVKEGIFPNEEKVKNMKMNDAMLNRQKEEGKQDEEAAEEQEEELEENDDEAYLKRMRAKDEYKDAVRRGDGNRHNRS